MVKEKRLIFSMIVFMLVLLFLGNSFYEKKLEASNKESYINYQAKKQMKEANQQAEYEAMLTRYDPMLNEKQSLLDFLHFKALTEDEVVISVIGSDIVAGASDVRYNWSTLLENKLKEDSNFKNLKLTNYSGVDYTTTSILENNITDLVIKDQPDVLFFETSLINNHTQPISMINTVNQIEEIYETISSSLPDTKIILIVPHPISSNLASLNVLGNIYTNYITETKKVIERNQWQSIDMKEGMELVIEEKGIPLEDILDKGKYLNDEGNQIWFDLLYDYLSKEQLGDQ